MSTLDPGRISDIETRIESGLRQHATSRQSKTQAIQLADQIASVGETAADAELLDLDAAQTVQQSFNQITPDTLRRLRKITEVVEDSFSINVGHSKFARAAATATNLSSIAAFVLAGQNLFISATKLDRAHETADSINNIKTKFFFDFYASACVFIGEGFLLTTPFNFKFAWKGVRYLNNRYLYRLRKYSSALYRLILSEIHYAIRGIIPAALRDTDAFVTYLSSMTVQTIKMLDQVSTNGIEDLQREVENSVTGFKRFVETKYEVVTPDVNLQKVALKIYQRILDEVDLSTIPTV